MNNLIFQPKLKKQLDFFLNSPAKTPHVLCFHGLPGVGKTEFAKYLGDAVAEDCHYLDANSSKQEGNSTKHVVSFIKDVCRQGSLFATGDKHFKRCFIIDEFHNFTDDRQDGFKVVFDELERLNCLVIICCNTNKTKNIDKTIVPAIRSRSKIVSFNVVNEGVEELVTQAKEQFPMLTKKTIRGLLPDWRSINMEAKMAS